MSFQIPLVRVVVKGYNVVTRSRITVTVNAPTLEQAKLSALHSMPHWKAGNFATNINHQPTH